MPTYTYTGSERAFTVPTTGTYDITAYGAQGGIGNDAGPGDGGYAGGYGAEIGGDFTVAAGSVLTIIVGGEGGQALGLDFGGGGGGGGSFVIDEYNGVRTVLVIAGGGGGGGYYHGGNGGLTTSAGGAGGGPSGGTGGDKGSGGHLGSAASGGGGYQGGNGGAVGGAGGADGKGYGIGYAGGIGFVGPGYENGPGGFGGGGAGGGKFGGGGGGGGGYSGGGGGGTLGYGGGGGGSIFNGTNEVASAAENAGNGKVVIDFICYLRGTRILTPIGEVLVEDLAIGDTVLTRFNGIQTIKWIGHQRFASRFVSGNRGQVPVHIRSGALGDRLPARDLFISPGHSMLVEGNLLLGRLLVNGITITQDWCPDEIHYIHIELDRHDCVVAEGAWSETFADTPDNIRGTFHNATEFAALYSDIAPSRELVLCAPRPEHGDALDTALRPVVAHNVAALASGQLRGFIDNIAAPRLIEGWAQDIDHPEMPVLLEAALDDRVIGTALACHYRPDLETAGIGQGRCGFRLTTMEDLRHETIGALRIRRVADGAEISMTEGCSESFETNLFTALVSRTQKAA